MSNYRQLNYRDIDISQHSEMLCAKLKSLDGTTSRDPCRELSHNMKPEYFRGTSKPISWQRFAPGSFKLPALHLLVITFI